MAWALRIKQRRKIGCTPYKMRMHSPFTEHEETSYSLLHEYLFGERRIRQPTITYRAKTPRGVRVLDMHHSLSPTLDTGVRRALGDEKPILFQRRKQDAALKSMPTIGVSARTEALDRSGDKPPPLYHRLCHHKILLNKIHKLEMTRVKAKLYSMVQTDCRTCV